MKELNPNSKKVSFDVDSVLLQTEDVILSYIKENYSVDLKTEDVTYWDFYKDNYPTVFTHLFSDASLYEQVPAVSGMERVLEACLDEFGGSNIQFVTASHPNMVPSKEGALRKHFGHLSGYDDVEIVHVGMYGDVSTGCHNKFYYTDGSILIDDAIHNIEGHLEYNEKNKALLFDRGYGWNQGFAHSRVVRVGCPESTLAALFG